MPPFTCCKTPLEVQTYKTLQNCDDLKQASALGATNDRNCLDFAILFVERVWVEPYHLAPCHRAQRSQRSQSAQVALPL